MGAAISSSYVNKRLQVFSGFINKVNSSNPKITESTGVPFMTYFSENGSYIIKDYIPLGGGLLTSSIQIKDSTRGYYGQVRNSSIIYYEISTKPICPANSIIDELEYGCFQNCITVTYPIDAFKCNPIVKGCNNEGQFKPDYQCMKNSQLTKKKYKSNSKLQNATMYSPNEILVTINDTINTSSSNIYVYLKGNRIPYVTPNFFIEDHDNFFSELYVKLTNFSEILCQKSILIDLSKMNIRNDEGETVFGQALYVSNLEIIPCNQNTSDLSEIVVSNSSVLMDKLSAVSIGSSLASFNPISIIALLNCINELTLFQLINLGKSYPININAFFNTTASYSFNFLPNVITFFINPSYEYQNSWFDNNIGNNNDLQGTSFLINIMAFLPIIFGGFLVFFFAGLFFQYGSSFRNVRNNISINFLISFSKGFIYKILIVSLAGIYFDNANSDYFSFISGICSYIFISSQFLLLSFYILLMIRFRNNIDNPESESLIGSLFEDVQITSYTSITAIFLNLKLQIILCLAFILQNWGYIQIASFILVYVLALIIRIFAWPSSSCLDNIQLLIRDLLFLSLISLFLTFKIMVDLKNTLVELLKEIILFNIVIIILNEFLFSFIGLLSMLINSCIEQKVRSKFLSVKFKTSPLRNELILDKYLMNSNSKGRMFNTLQLKNLQRIRRQIYNKLKLKSEEMNDLEKGYLKNKFQSNLKRITGK